MIVCHHRVQYKQNTAYTAYYVHTLLHYFNIVWLQLPANLSSYRTSLTISCPRCTVSRVTPYRFTASVGQPHLTIPPISIDHGNQVHVQTPSMKASKFSLSWPASASPILRDLGLKIYFPTPPIMAYMDITNLLVARPPRSHDYGLQLHLQPPLSKPPIAASKSQQYGSQVLTIMASQCISNFAWLRPPSTSLSSLQLQTHLQTLSTTASK
jgi:hypothetical protein